MLAERELCKTTQFRWGEDGRKKGKNISRILGDVTGKGTLGGAKGLAKPGENSRKAAHGRRLMP